MKTFLMNCVSVNNYRYIFSICPGFTSMSHEVPPQEVMGFLNELFTQMDALTDEYGVYKV